MSNATGAFGLRPVRHLSGAPWNGQTIRGYCGSNYGTALYIGDPVTISPTAGDRDATAKYPTLNTHAGTSGLVVRAVIVSFEPNPANLSQQYRPASQERWANIVLATPDLVFQIRDDGSGTPAKSTFPGANAEMVAGSGGSTITGLSSFALDASTPSTTQAFPLHILGLSDIPDNELADYAIWDVLINTCFNTTGLILGVTAA
jgi:hypothetical protein